jgi:hypothetical protein
MLPAHQEILSIQLVTNNKYARQVRSCAAGFRNEFVNLLIVDQDMRAEWFLFRSFTSKGDSRFLALVPV